VSTTSGIDKATVDAIVIAVESQGGDIADVQDLAATWERLHADERGRTARLRFEAARPRCGCVDNGVAGSADRCERCYGLIRDEARL
jgi:hypothetical protein